MSYDALHDEGPEVTNEDVLRTEFGWYDVHRGLGRLLMGWGILIGGTILCMGAAVAALIFMAKGGRDGNAFLTSLWVFYLGTGLMTLVTLFGYGYILIGKWTCLMNASERHGAKWLMFACITCILMGPGLNVAAWVCGMEESPKVERGFEGLLHVKFSKLGGSLQLASSAVSVASLIFFLLFLRAVAACFEDRGRLFHATFFLVLLIAVYAGTLYLVFVNQRLLFRRNVLIGVAGAWVIGLIWYLVLIVSFRGLIYNTMKSLRSPLQREQLEEPAAY